jgi:hypothetical protein
MAACEVDREGPPGKRARVEAPALLEVLAPRDEFEALLHTRITSDLAPWRDGIGEHWFKQVCGIGGGCSHAPRPQRGVVGM